MSIKGRPTLIVRVVWKPSELMLVRAIEGQAQHSNNNGASINFLFLTGWLAGWAQARPGLAGQETGGQTGGLSDLQISGLTLSPRLGSRSLESRHQT